MTTIRVMIEMDVAVENSTALREGAAQTAFDVQRNIDRRGGTTSGRPEEVLEFAQAADTMAVASLLSIELPRTQQVPGCRLLRSTVRAFEIVPDVPEGTSRVD